MPSKDMIKKISTGLTLRCIGALAAGIITMTAFVTLLSLYGETSEPALKTASTKHLRFPENEKMLKEMSDQLAREATSLSNIAPAAGNALPSKPQTAPQTQK